MGFHVASSNEKVKRKQNIDYISIAVIPNIPISARWAQKGITVAGGNGRGVDLNQLYNPYGICVDDEQTIFIADKMNQRIVQWKMYDTNGRVAVDTCKGAHASMGMRGPSDLVIDKAADKLMVCDRWGRQVIRWSRHADNSEGEIVVDNIDCFGIAVDDDNHFYISDVKSNQVKQYRMEGDREGIVVAGSGTASNSLNDLDQPTFICIDLDQAIYVSDSNNHRIVKWEKGATSGIVVAGGQGEGYARTQLSFPNGICVDASGTLYVADTQNHRIMRWPKAASEGSIVVGRNGKGNDESRLDGPIGIAFDRDNNLYVADRVNQRVQRFFFEH